MTAGEYEAAWKARERAKNPPGKAAPLRKPVCNRAFPTLAHAREFIGDVLWLFDEANRKLERLSLPGGGSELAVASTLGGGLSLADSVREPEDYLGGDRRVPTC